MLILFIFTISPLVISLSTAQVGGGVIVLFCRMFEHVSFFLSTVKGSQIRNLTFFLLCTVLAGHNITIDMGMIDISPISTALHQNSSEMEWVF